MTTMHNYGESITPSAKPSRPGRTSLADILQRGAQEPSATEVILAAADALDSRLKTAELGVAEAELALSIDADTGLWTEQKFNQEVDAWARQEDADPNTHIAIVFIDMNDLKRINDTLGHSAGDEAIKRLAEKLRHIADYGLREGDFRAVSRSNKAGDEFMLALPAREVSDLQNDESHGNLNEALQAKISDLIYEGHIESQYASGWVIATRGEILENGLELYKHLADEEMYKNKQIMKLADKVDVG